MNIITGEVIEIVSLERLNLLKVRVNTQTVNVLMLEMNIDLKKGSKVELMIKPTAMYVINEECDFENVLNATVKNINKGRVLMNVEVDVEGFSMEVVMLKKELNKDVRVVFKSSDIAVSRIVDD